MIAISDIIVAIIIIEEGVYSYFTSVLTIIIYINLYYKNITYNYNLLGGLTSESAESIVLNLCDG